MRSMARKTSARFFALLIHDGSLATSVIFRFRPVESQGGRSRSGA